MKRGFTVVVICVVIGLSQALVLHAQAPAAPGAGHGFLIDKHVAAGLTCAKCHIESTAKAPETATCLACHGGRPMILPVRSYWTIFLALVDRLRLLLVMHQRNISELCI